MCGYIVSSRLATTNHPELSKFSPSACSYLQAVTEYSGPVLG